MLSALVLVPLIALPAHGPPAPWYEPPAPRELGHPLQEALELATGESHGLVATHDGKEVFLISDATVVPVTLPDGWRWVGLGDADAILVAGVDGTFGRLGEGGAVTQLEKLPHAVTWDAAGRTIAMSDGTLVVVSIDGGKTFQTARPGGKITHVFTRADGVVVAQGNPTWITRDSGRTWGKSRFQPRNLVRTGAIVWNGQYGCAAVLSSDAETWVRIDPFSTFHAEVWSDWSPLMYPSQSPHGGGSSNRHRTPTVPAAPAPSVSKPVLREGECGDGDGEGLGLGGIGMSGGRGCSGVGCLQGTVDRAVRDTRTEAGFLGDGGHHLAVIDRAAAAHPSVSLRTLPPRCAPRDVHVYGGLVLLLCDGDHPRVFTTSRGDPAWHDEGELAAHADDLFAVTQAADGTLLQHLHCKGEPVCRALVRAPSGAWRTVSIPDALTYRVAERGAVVAVVGPDLGLWVDEGGSLRSLVRATVPGDVHWLTVDADGKVEFSAVVGNKKPTYFFVAEDGRVVPAPPPKIGRSKEGYEIVDAIPIEP